MNSQLSAGSLKLKVGGLLVPLGRHHARPQIKSVYQRGSNPVMRDLNTVPVSRTRPLFANWKISITPQSLHPKRKEKNLQTAMFSRYIPGIAYVYMCMYVHVCVHLNV